MLEQYIPKKFCREFVTEGFGAQLPLIMATVKGIKPVSDIWVGTTRYSVFKEICKKYGLLFYPNGIFINPSEDMLKKIYQKNPDYKMSTTKVIGIPFNEKKLENIQGVVHIFISRNKEKLDDAVKYGWYPQIIRDKVIEKPPIDLIRFGYALGYPECCVDFFNVSHKPEIPMYYNRLVNTKSKPSIYCNNMLNHISYSYIHHSSCSFDCENTIVWAKKIEEAINEEEPEYVELLRKALKMPIITWGEKHSYVFDGHTEKNRIIYKDFKFIGDNRDNVHKEIFEKGNVVQVFDDRIVVFDKMMKVGEIRKEKKEWGFMVEFE